MLDLVRNSEDRFSHDAAHFRFALLEGQGHMLKQKKAYLMKSELHLSTRGAIKKELQAAIL